MSQLPILDDQRRSLTSRWSFISTALRCLLVLMIAAAIRLSVTQNKSSSAKTRVSITPQQVVEFLPGAVKILPPISDGVQPVLDVDDSPLGFALTTLPIASHIVGYRGPSNTLLVMNETSKVVAASLINSEDTPEHVDAILKDEQFFQQFRDWTLGEPQTFSTVDAVSGATLTSMAIAEGIAVCLGGEKPSLRFPESLTASDLTTILDTTTNVTLGPVNTYSAHLVDSSGNRVGALIRTGPLVDSIAGYQGPSELLIQLDAAQLTQRIQLRNTFDNQPYAGYLKTEPYFWKVFQQKTLRQVAEIDLEAEQVEGVSGATMTSMAVAATMLAAAQECLRRETEERATIDARRIQWGYHDIGTLLVLICGTTISLTRLRSYRWLRIAWNCILVGYLGLVTGNLISLAIVMGWAAKGIAWRLAPGLAAIVVVGFLLSSATRHNVYCTHLCPHGAAQQLLRRPRNASKRWRKWLRHLWWLPAATLLFAAAVTLFGSDFNLAALEPFNAWIWYVAGASSIAVAITSLIVSAFVPMAYCRYACGTGRLLEYVRRSSRSHRFTAADGVAVAIAVIAWGRLLA